MIQEKSKKILTRILIVIITLVLILFIWFCSFNVKKIKGGRNIDIVQILDTSYESKDGNFYLYFIDEEIVKVKSYDKDSEIVFNGIVKYSYVDGYITIKDEKINDSGIAEYKIIDSETIYFYTKNTYLYN